MRRYERMLLKKQTHVLCFISAKMDGGDAGEKFEQPF